jgi:2-polyprenyl-3-methyl-5-hydroxy-6-metoxy-1,4-benzoquinol methylase
MFLDNQMVDPISRKRLVLNHSKNVIENLNSTLFEGRLEDQIPIILPKGQASSSTQLHDQSNSKFDYVDHYKKDAEVFDYFQEPCEISENERHRLNQLILDKLGDDAEKILDVGCGNGWLSESVQKDNNHVVSLDVSIINVKRVLQQTPHPNHSGLVADVFNLPFPDNSFDAIVASEIIEHVHDPKRFVDCLLAVLKPNGKLIITTPYNEIIQVHLCVHCNHLTPENAHLHSFNEQNVAKLINADVRSWHFSKASNKHFIKLRIYWLLRAIPFRLWRALDKLANRLIKSPTRFIIEIRK